MSNTKKLTRADLTMSAFPVRVEDGQGGYGQSEGMTLRDYFAAQTFADELDKLVERFRVEYEISYASVVGVLAMKSHLLCGEAEERADDQERTDEL